MQAIFPVRYSHNEGALCSGEDGSSTELLTTDQPVKLGGRDLGPDPMSMLLASLLGCEQYVVDLAAKDLSMDIHSVAYEVQGDYDVRGFLGDEGVPSHFQRLRIKASVITKESEEKLAELARIVQKRCPVSDLFQAAGIDLQVKFVKV
ncbi:hypothetical protein CBR_g27808 [Chara braunii]|uniref:OsmC family peroxiredoxin n=1 Tax=Chara braunii TaxID=69332 RepID=A0A388L8R9_CHABU|nr:hypothetical protein CBR_g27808 [Chara braunii]|eukprot:GBG78583.1 hypothetical protein CBR_g27808 [Chara braunii]